MATTWIITSITELEDALDPVTGAANGDTLFFEPGDYSSVLIDIADGRDLTFTSANAGHPWEEWPEDQVVLNRIASNGSITVDGIHVHETERAPGWVDGGWEAISVATANESITVKNSLVTVDASADNTATQAFGVIATYGTSSITVENTHFGPFEGDFDTANSANYGIYVNGSTDPADTIDINNNVFDLGTGRNVGVKLAHQIGGSQVQITGNQFGDAGDAEAHIRIDDEYVAPPNPASANNIGPGQDFSGIDGNDFEGAIPPINNLSQYPIIDNGSANLNGTDADETFVADGGNDNIDGGGNTAIGDTIDMSAAGTGGSYVDLDNGFAHSSNTGLDHLENIENIKGSAGDDGLFGNGSDNTFFATAGDDLVDGRNGWDTFDASSGAAAQTVDMWGSLHSADFDTQLNSIERVLTGTGDDTIYLRRGFGNDFVDNTVDGGAGVDTAHLDANLDEVEIAWHDDNGGWFGTDADGGDTFNNLANVEKLHLNDETVWLVRSEAELADALAGGLSGAQPGDTILLAPGDYDMDITLKDGVDIRGLSRDDVIINGAIVVPAGLTDVKVEGLTVHNASASGYLLDMRAASNSTLTDIVFENVTFALVGDFLPVNGPGTFSNDAPIGNSYARGTISVDDQDGDGAGLTFHNVTMDSGDFKIGTAGNEIAMLQVESIDHARVVMDDLHVNGLNTSAANLGAQLNISGNGGDDWIDFVHGGTSGGGNLYISGFEHVTVDDNTFDGQGLALNGAKDAKVTSNWFQNIDSITSNGSQHRGLTIEDAWGTDGVSGLTITGNHFIDISAPDGAIAFQRFTDGGATIDNLDGVVIGDNEFSGVDTPIYTDSASFTVPGAVLPDDLSDDHLVLATSDDDEIDGAGGNDVVFGDAGTDAFNYDGALTTASFTYSNGGWSVTGSEGTDTLEGVERVIDANGKVFLLVGADGSDGFAHIQDAINAASGDETILIASGTYAETSQYVPGDFQGLYINKPNLTLVGFSSDTGSAVTSADEARDHGPTVISGAENMFGANHWIDAGGSGTTITGLHLQAGSETGNKLLEIWADDTSVTDSFVDVYDGGATYTGAIAVYYNEDGSHEVESYTFSDNILNEGIMVANGVGDPGLADQQLITGNRFVGTEAYDTITLQGQVLGVGWLLSPAGLPTIEDNTLDGNTTPFLLRFADDSLDSILSREYVEDFLANNTGADTTYAYVLTSTGDLRMTLRDYGAGPTQNYYVTNSIDSLNLALDTTADDLFYNLNVQRITQHAGDTIVVQSGSGTVDSEIMVNNLTVLATENSADLNLTLATTLADGTPIAGGGVAKVTLADYATGQGANVDVIGNALANTIIGNSGSNALSGGAGADSLDGGAGADNLSGGDNDDTIFGGDGNDTIDGGSGIDTAVFEHAINEYTIQRTGGTYAITRNGTVDTVSGVESFKFGSQTINVQGASADAIINQFAPVFDPAGAEAVSIAENVANVVVYDANATDADSAATFGNIVYSLEGADAGAFSINSANGQVTLTAAADRETKASYALTIRASQGVTTSTKALTVNVTDVNDNPVVFTSGATASVQENSSTGTVVYNADATDKDTGTMVYSLAGTDAGAFNIDAATGEVRLKAAADFETRTSYAFSVVATQGGSSASQAVTLTVTNVDEGIVSGVDAKTVQVEAGSTKAALGTLSSNAALTFDVVAVNNGGGHVYLGDTELAVGVTGLTQAQINSLTFSSVNDGSIQFLAHDGGNTDELNVILDVTAGVGKTYTGDSGANTIDGADGNDTILGKAGADHLLGGAGKDTIDGGAGADWIDGGAGKDSITGGKGNDTIFGGAGKDHLDGGKGDDELHGGLGKDTLTGGSGADKFVFDTALAANNADVIEDFVHGKDTIVLDSDIFAALGAKVGSKEFRANLSGDAQDKNDKLIYETDTGKLYYDADGNKSGDKVLVATFDPHVSNLSHLDFEIV